MLLSCHYYMTVFNVTWIQLDRLRHCKAENKYFKIPTVCYCFQHACQQTHHCWEQHCQTVQKECYLRMEICSWAQGRTDLCAELICSPHKATTVQVMAGEASMLWQRDLLQEKSVNQNFPYPLRLPTTVLVSGKMHFHCNRTKAPLFPRRPFCLSGSFSPMALTFRSFGAQAELSSSESEQK